MALSQNILDDLGAFAAGREDWGYWPKWFAMYARQLASELSALHMHWLKLHPREEIALILGELGIEIDPSMPSEHEHQLCYDPIEDNPDIQPALNAARAAAKRQLREFFANREPHYLDDTGNCHLFWHWQKTILREQHGIEWKSPAEMNPDVRFD